MRTGITRTLAQIFEPRPPAARARARASSMRHHAVLAALTMVFALFLGGGAEAASTTAAPAELRAGTAAAPCGYNGAHPTLRQGDRGAAVRHAQCLLNRIWGYPIAIDGAFGPNTASAVRGHQRDCNIAVDGVIGPQTWRALHPDTAPGACGS